MSLKNYTLLADVAFAFALSAVAADTARAQTANTSAEEAEASSTLSTIISWLREALALLFKSHPAELLKRRPQAPT
jgi:hypothetical protein